MRRLLILALSLLAFSLSAFALVPKPYIGGSLEFVNPTGDFSKKDFTSFGGGAKTTLGGEADLGLTNSMGSAYLGYRWTKIKASGDVVVNGAQIGGVNAWWWLNRWVLGARWNIFGPTPLPITPTLGAGLTWGKSDLDANGSGAAANLKTSKLSGPSLGWFIEGGAIISLTHSLSLTGDVQYNQFNAEFKSPLPGVYHNGTVKVSYFLVGAGLRVLI
jgi:hypothetical protein